MKAFLLVVGLFFTTVVFGQEKKFDGWNEFAKTKFEAKFSEKLGQYMFYPNFPTELKALEGKEVVIEGFYVPFGPEDGSYIVISKYPQSQCFFCGGGGPESVAEVHFVDNQRKFQADDLIKVKGKLKLNADDYDHVNFILDQSVLLSK